MSFGILRELYPLFIGTTLLFAGSASHAGSVNVQTHVPAANASYTKNESASGPGRDRWFMGLDYNLVNDPLVVLNPTRERRLDTVLDSLQTLDVSVVRDFAESFALGGSMPLHMAHPVAGSRSTSLGDARLFAKIYLLGKKQPWQISLIPELTLPTGDASLFLSNSSAGYGALIAVERTFGAVSLVANAGYRGNPGAIFRDMDYRRKVPLGLGALVRFSPKWAANFEVSGTRILPYNRYNNPAEFYAGARFRPSSTSDLVLSGGASVGAMRDASSAGYRVLFGLSYSPAQRTPAYANTSPIRDELKTSRAGAIPRGNTIELDVGSSRVDLQACKLEYSIVSPK